MESDLAIAIVSPAPSSEGVPVIGPELVATINRPLLQPDFLEVELTEGGDGIFLGGTRYFGRADYSATDLEIAYRPFNILRSGAEYELVVRAEGEEAAAAFTTDLAFTGASPPLEDRTYDLRIREITHPKELAGIFNAQLESAPPVLLHVVDVDRGEQAAEIRVVSSTGRPGDPMGEAQVLAEDETHPTTTSVRMDGRVEGPWLSAGPFDLHTTASGVALVIRELFVTALLAGDGGGLDSITVTGVIDPDELGHALDLDLDFLCTDDRFAKHCDEDGRLRVAARLEAMENPSLPFTTFVTSPVNGFASVGLDTAIEIAASAPLDPERTSVRLSSGGADVPGTLEVSGKTARFVPAALLAPSTRYEVEARGVSVQGTDARHAAFTTR
jgi:hypothetical protein